MTTDHGKIRELMEQYIAGRIKAISSHLEGELQLAFLAGVQVGLDEGNRITDLIFANWERRNDLRSEAH